MTASSLGRATQAIAAIALAIPVVYAMVSPVPLVVPIVVVALAALTWIRPVEALIALVSLFPLSSRITLLLGIPWLGSQFGELLVLTFLAAWILRSAVRGNSWSSDVGRWSLLFGIVVICSAAIVGINTFGSDAFWPDLWTSLAQFVTVHVPREAPGAWHTAFDIAAALILCAVTVAVTGGDPLDRRRLIRGLALGVTAAALLNVVVFAEAVIADENSRAALRWHWRTLRVNVHFADVNAAGSFFGMLVVMTIGLARSAGRGRWLWSIPIAILIAALWLAGSRSGLAATVLAAAGAAVWERGGRHWTRRSIAVGIGALALAASLAAGVLWKTPRAQANVDPQRAVEIRQEYLLRAMRMTREHPAFGVGLGQFFVQSDRYATRGRRENAHNDLAQITAELGVVGGLAFLAILLAVLRVPVARDEAGHPSRLDVWLRGGLAAFLLSGLAGHPLIVFEVAIPFWFALGLAAAPASVRTQRPGSAIPVIPIAIALLALAFPVRIYLAHRAASEPSIPWQEDEGVRFRDVGTRDTMVLPPPLSAVLMPLKIIGAGEHTGIEVSIAVDDRIVNRVTVPPDGWTPIRVLMPGERVYRNRRVSVEVVNAPPGARLLVGRVTPYR